MFTIVVSVLHDRARKVHKIWWISWNLRPCICLPVLRFNLHIWNKYFKTQWVIAQPVTTSAKLICAWQSNTSVRSRWLVFYGPWRSRGHWKHKKERGQYLAIVTEQAGSMKDLLNGWKEDFCTRDQREKCRAGKMSPAKINLMYYLKIHFARHKPIEPKQSGVVAVYNRFLIGYLSAWIANQNRAFASTCPLADLAI